MAGVQIARAWVGISGSNVRSFNSRGVVAVAGKDREIGREDVTRVIDAARGVQIPQDHEVVHVIPREFAVDGQDGVDDPTGMVGARLEADVHVVTAPVAVTQNIVTCMPLTISIDGIIESCCASWSVLKGAPIAV